MVISQMAVLLLMAVSLITVSLQMVVSLLTTFPPLMAVSLQMAVALLTAVSLTAAPRLMALIPKLLNHLLSSGKYILLYILIFPFHLLYILVVSGAIHH